MQPQDAWIIYSYGGGEFLASIFSSLAMIFGTAGWGGESAYGGFLTLLKTSALVGSMCVLTSAALTGRFLNLRWLPGMFFIYLVAVYPKIDILILDPVHCPDSASIGTAPPHCQYPVDNVPVGIAVPASMASRTSHFLAEVFEKAFQPPAGGRHNPPAYTRSGLGMAQAHTARLLEYGVNDPVLSENLAGFWICRLTLK